MVDQLGSGYYGGLGERCCGVKGNGDRDRVIGCPWGCEEEERKRQERVGGGHREPASPKGDVRSGAQWEV